MSRSLVFALSLATASVAGAALAPPAHAQAKPAYRNGQDVEAQGPDGRWYQGRIWKVKKGSPTQYEIRWTGLPPAAKAWVPEDKIREKGSGETVDPKSIQAVMAAKQAFQGVVNHGKKGKWTDDRWNAQLDGLMAGFEAKVAHIEANWPDDPQLAQLKGLIPKLHANAEQRRKEAGGAAASGPVAAGETEQVAAFYKASADAAKNFPYSIDAKTIAGTAALLEAFNLATVEARMAEDAKKYAGVFAYYGMESNKYADLPYGGKRAPNIADPHLKKVHQFYVKTIFELKGRMAGKDQEIADGVAAAIAKAEDVDGAMAAVRLAAAIKSCFPKNPHIAARAAEADAHLQAKLKEIAALIAGPFHTDHMRQYVAFSAQQKLGAEQPGQVVTAITPGKPLYLKGYLTESIKSLGFKRRDSMLGYETVRVPDLRFQFEGQKGDAWRLPVYSALRGDDLAKVGVIEIDLLPDPGVTYPTHFQYLPALHFTQWMLAQPDGQHTLRLSSGPGYGTDPTKKGAHGALTLNLDPESRKALQAYYDQLWAKKLSTVVFPDTFGTEDKRGSIGNEKGLAQYGKLLKVTAAETNKVMKPFPLQHEVANYVGQGYGLFERPDGRYVVIGLGFTRKPGVAEWDWRTLSGTPDDYKLAGSGKNEVLPTLLDHGYEIPKANLDKTGSW